MSGESQYHEDHLKPVKHYLVADLFYTRWDLLKQLSHADVFILQQKIKTIDRNTAAGSIEYGFTIIAILQRLNKNPLLVDHINEEQAVDIYNDLKFLNEPWYFFPELDHWSRPDDQMARHTFDQFIYADNEFTMYLVTHDEKYLSRLAATLYTRPGEFDKEMVAERANQMKLEAHQLQLIFYTYSHVREYVVGRCKHLLPKAPKTEDEQPPQSSGPMWHEVKHHAARTLVFGDFNSLGRSNMYSVLDHLELLAREKPNGKS